jgi:antitoxin CptB
MSDLDRIRWDCRRGMLELDLLLERFNRDHLPHLETKETAQFAELLCLPDPELFDLLMGRAAPVRFAEVLNLLTSPRA